jgi:hypothetical protein
MTQQQEREIRIVGELKQQKEQYKRDTTKLSSERDALEDAGSSTADSFRTIFEAWSSRLRSA